MVWRIIQFQPQYPPVQKWQKVFGGTNRTLKKKAVVAIGRQLIIICGGCKPAVPLLSNFIW